MSTQQFSETFPFNQSDKLSLADALTTRSIGSNSFGMVRYDQVWMSNDDTIDHLVECRYVSGSFTIHLGTVNVPTGAGHGTVPAVELFAAIFGSASQGVVLPQTDYLTLSVLVAMVGTAVLSWVAFGGTL